ncbi:PAP2-domain-containing protein [Heliocybe sulcata]|uniref:PAP2-domain-containing protein n=1 Tax=Heliocybe sulcata TaxID=5364 RepID=A0A5C3N525_9AGAM|nr:PAP2-domain-containing protein [Heliocybe sulcata]
MSIRISSLPRPLATVLTAFVAAVGRMDKSLSPSDTMARLRQHTFTFSDSIYIFHLALAAFWITLMQFPPFPLKLAVPILYTILLLIPLTSQFFLPFVPVASWILTFYSSRFIPEAWRPSISVSLLPTLETVLYGANVSDILTRFTHPALDILAWLPYGIIHFVFPFVVAAFIWLFRPKQALHLWARTFGYMNLIGVIVQILLPCAAPWYELIYGLTPANYSMPGSAGGLGRIDALFGSHGYETTFSHSPVVFGAFPSLHAGCATIEALFISHFFPQMTRYIWAYAGVLYWATMYLTHHYLVDVVGGACLAIACFYLFLPDEFRGPLATASPTSPGRRSKYDAYNLEEPRSRVADMDDFELSSAEEDEMDIPYRSPLPGQQQQMPSEQGKKSHRHTASIASLIRAEERVEDGWSPIMGTFAFPPGSPAAVARERDREDARV